MKFRTEVIPKTWEKKISHSDELVSIGSCFATEIGMRLKRAQFTIDVNPFGTVFNPHSMAQILKGALETKIRPDLFIQREKNWCHFDFHSTLNAESKDELAKHLSSINSNTREALHKASYLFLTFGSAWAYKHIGSGCIVSNCHKLPQNNFVKELCDLQKLKDAYMSLFSELNKINPKLQIVLTVSPVRYTRDGIHENNLSKSILLLLADYLEKQFHFVDYFSAYELVADDLRDYRFYKSDLVHPTEQAIDYVFEKFKAAAFSETTIQLTDLAESISRLTAHRPLISDAGQHEKLNELVSDFEKQSGKKFQNFI